MLPNVHRALRISDEHWGFLSLSLTRWSSARYLWIYKLNTVKDSSCTIINDSNKSSHLSGWNQQMFDISSWQMTETINYLIFWSTNQLMN